MKLLTGASIAALCLLPMAALAQSEKVIVTGGLTAGMKVLENPRAAEPGQRVRLAQ